MNGWGYFVINITTGFVSVREHILWLIEERVCLKV